MRIWLARPNIPWSGPPTMSLLPNDAPACIQNFTRGDDAWAGVGTEQSAGGRGTSQSIASLSSGAPLRLPCVQFEVHLFMSSKCMASHVASRPGQVPNSSGWRNECQRLRQRRKARYTPRPNGRTKSCRIRRNVAPLADVRSRAWARNITYIQIHDEVMCVFLVV